MIERGNDVSERRANHTEHIHRPPVARRDPRGNCRFAYANNDGGALSEDLSFCKRWVAGCGGEIWADTESTISHHGSWTYTGRYADLLN
jgi:hypothetical protein